MNASELKKSYHIGIHELPDPQGMNVVQISGLDGEEFDAKENGRTYKDWRHLLRFTGWSIPLRLNNTKISALIAALGEDTEKWVGRKIGLYVAMQKSFGEDELKVCIHIQPFDEHQAVPQPARVGRTQLDNRRMIASEFARAAGAAQAALPPGGGAVVFDIKPIGMSSADKYRASMAELGANMDNVLAWMKGNAPREYEACWGKQLSEWPMGAKPAMFAFLKAYPGAPIDAAPLQPTVPPTAPPTPPSALPRVPSLPVPRVPAVVENEPGPVDDIPF